MQLSRRTPAPSQPSLVAVALAAVFAGLAAPAAAGDPAAFTLVRAQIEIDEGVVQQTLGADRAEAVGHPAWYAGASAGFGSNGALATVGIPTGTVEHEAFGESWWADGFVLGGGSGSGVLDVSVRISGSLRDAGNSIYALYASASPFDAAALRSWFDSGMPDAPPGSSPAIPLTEGFAGTTLFTARIPFTYGVPFYVASYLGAETWGPGSADFLGSARFGATAPGGGAITGLSGTTYALAAAVPEPETYALMAAGLGLVGLAARRRSRTQR